MFPNNPCVSEQPQLYTRKIHIKSGCYVSKSPNDFADLFPYVNPSGRVRPL